MIMYVWLILIPLALNKGGDSSPLMAKDQERIFESKVKSADSHKASLYARSVPDFAKMTWCALNRNPFDFIGYGCFCGPGGHGTPVDDTDRCCQIHDNCYNTVRISGNCPFDSLSTIYSIPYSRKGCYGCEPADYYWFYGKCRSSLCECDSEAMQCFMRFKFNDAYKNYSRDRLCSV